MANWQPVMRLAELAEGGITKASVGGADLILLKCGDDVMAYEDACPHEAHPLSQGELEGDVLICSKHLWEFEIRTGKHISRLDRPETSLSRFPVRIVAGAIEVDLAAPSNPRPLSGPRSLAGLS
ncbi:MAG TPA: Rieske (2Fe-2S) protein [Alphaproteobacteria bacterium]|nr:Rieske (2Fe-2S) protein [Alphaproteobacteria bacterium]